MDRSCVCVFVCHPPLVPTVCMDAASDPAVGLYALNAHALSTPLISN